MSRILFVEDDADLRDSFTRLLTMHGHTVKACKNFDEFLAALTTLIPGDDLVLLTDWDLGPGSNGGEVAQNFQDFFPNKPRAIVWSGLRREVPEGVEFFSKDNLLKLLESLDEGSKKVD